MTEPGVDTEITCPVCDEKVPAGSSSCPSCSTDLTLFQVNGERVEIEEDVQMANNGHIGDLLKAAEGDPFQSTVAQASSVEMFECPECNKMIPEDAASCPNCGVEFAEGDVFECPLCQTLVDINVDKCPNCGAEFSDEEEEAVGSESPEPAAPEPAPAEPEKEMTFAERMKAMKEGEKSAEKPVEPAPAPVPEPEPEKEMTFAERMKAMKEGKGAESPEPVVQTESAPEPQPEVKAPVIPTKSEPVVQPAVEKPEPVKPTPTTTQPLDKAKLKEKYKELPKLIGMVKKYLAVAKRCEVDVTKSRSLINQAVAAGKNKDLESAVRLVEEGKSGIEKTITSYLNGRLENLNMKIEGVSDGQASPEAVKNIETIKASISIHDFESALSEIERTEGMLKSSVGEDVLDAKTELKKMMITIDDAKVLNIELGEALALYNEAEKSAQLDDWSTKKSKRGMIITIISFVILIGTSSESSIPIKSIK